MTRQDSPDAELSPRKLPRQERSTKTVDRIVEAAVRVFDDAGYQAATTNEIALAAAVSVGSLYQYFPNKDALLVEIAHRHIASTLTVFDELIARVDHGVDLESLIDKAIRLLVSQHEHDRLHLLIAHEAPRTTELDQELIRAHQHMVSTADRLLEVSVPEPQGRLIAAQVIVAVLDAAIHQVILRQPEGALREAAVMATRAAVMALVEDARQQRL